MVWIIPFIFVIGIVSWITIASIQKSSKLTSITTGKDEIAQEIEEHPFTLNPIIWIILVATIFIGIVIVYYAGNFG